MKKNGIISQSIESYYKECYGSYINNAKTMSKEAYFGENNKYVLDIVNQIDKMRTICLQLKENNPKLKNIELIKLIDPETNVLCSLFAKTFNMEGCHMGYFNTINAACLTRAFDPGIYGKSKETESLRIRLDDIVETSSGYRFRDSKGIWSCFLMGLPFIADKKIIETFTSEELTAIMFHECGHAMQHTLDSLNITVMKSIYQFLFLNLSNNKSVVLKKYNNISKIKKLLARMKEAKNDIDKAETLGKELIDSLEEDIKTKDNKSIKDLSNDDLTQSANGGTLEGDVEIRDKPRKTFFLIKIFNTIIVSVMSTMFSIFIIPCILSLFRKYNDGDLNYFKQFEEFADIFTAIYGLSKHQASFTLKIEKMISNYRPDLTYNIINYIPFLDLIKSYDQLNECVALLVAGYPPNYQRIVNLYIYLKSELDGNKQLTPTQKNEILAQMEDLSNIYKEFVNSTGAKGFFFRLLTKQCKKTIEEAAGDDRGLYERIIEPLRKKYCSK